jgi:hypothetical protein
MKRILCSLLLATLPFGPVLADAPQCKNAKITLVYQHELPNVPGKSIKGVLVEYGPAGTRAATRVFQSRRRGLESGAGKARPAAWR